MIALCAFCDHQSSAIYVQTECARRAHIENMTQSAIGLRLKALREEAGLSIRQMAEALGMPSGSSYAHYESRFKKPYLPIELTLQLEEIFNDYGIESERVRALSSPSEPLPEVEMPGFREKKSPRIDVSVLLDEADPPKNARDDKAGTIKLAIVEDTIQIAATVDADGFDELIRRLHLARQMIN